MLSLRVKILAVAVALVVLSQVGTVTGVLFTANRDVAERARSAMSVGAGVIEQTLNSEARQFENTVTALAADYGFKQAIMSGDAPTIESALSNHARRAGADIALLYDGNLRPMAVTGDPSILDGNKMPLIDNLGGTRPTQDTLVTNDRAYRMTAAPVRAPLPVAWLAMGFEIDANYAQRLEQLSGLRVSILAADGESERVLHSKLMPPGTRLQPGDEAFRKLANATRAAPATLTLDGAEHLALRQPIARQESALTLLLSQSITEAMAPYRLLQKAAIVLAAIPLVIALIGAAMLSRALTRPVQKLLEAALRIQAGDYSKPVAIRSGDELHQFAAAFNAMQTEISQREERIGHQARHDDVTGLYNRNHMLELLDETIAAAADGNIILVAIIRLNALRGITETLGSDIADAYLRQAATLLQQVVGASHALGRLEGDQFLLIAELAGATEARHLAEDLCGRLQPAVRLPNANIMVNPMAGMALYPKHGDHGEQLLRRAIVAANAEQRRPVRFYRDGDEEQRRRNMSLLADLREAAQTDQLQLHYQPKIRVADETVCGVEALVRWDHPEFGWLTPDSFVPVIEKSGNIGVLTRWAVRTALRDLHAWHERGADLSVAINFSAYDLHDRDLPWFIMDKLHEHGIAPERLVVEITEEATVRDFGTATEVLRGLRDLGINVSIDDFGTGYSSLSQLKKIPADELKIDRSFVAQLPDDKADASIVHSSIELAHSLGLQVVAEGVASGAALRWLRDHKVDRAQGYYWSPPLPATELIDWLRNFSGGSTAELPALQIMSD
jgi:diguanylate cyclase (GGDEF)-like protein